MSQMGHVERSRMWKSMQGLQKVWRHSLMVWGLDSSPLQRRHCSSAHRCEEKRTATSCPSSLGSSPSASSLSANSTPPSANGATVMPFVRGFTCGVAVDDKVGDDEVDEGTGE